MDLTEAFIELPHASTLPLKMFVFDTISEILKNEPRHFPASFLIRCATNLEKYKRITSDKQADDVLSLIAIEYSTRLKEFDRFSLSRMDAFLNVMTKWNGPQQELINAVRAVTIQDFKNLKVQLPIVSLEYLHNNGVDITPFLGTGSVNQAQISVDKYPPFMIYRLSILHPKLRTESVVNGLYFKNMKYVTETISKKLVTDSALHQKFLELFVPKSVAKNERNRPTICSQTTSAVIWRLFSRCQLQPKSITIWLKDLASVEVEFLIRAFFEEDVFSKQMFDLFMQILTLNHKFVHWEDVYNGVIYNSNCFQYLVSSGESLKFLNFLFENSGIDLESKIACTFGFAMAANSLNLDSSAFDELLQKSMEACFKTEGLKLNLSLNVTIKMVNYLKTKNKLTFALVVKIIEKIQASPRPNLELLLEMLRFILSKPGGSGAEGNTRDASWYTGRKNLFLKRVSEM